jgi:hypothetical protein
MTPTWESVFEDAKDCGANEQPPMQWESQRWRDWLAREGVNSARDAFEYLNDMYGGDGLTRCDVIHLADGARKDRGDAAMRFLIAVMLWGYADTDGRGPWRVAHMTAGADCNERVLAILDALETQDVYAAYRLIRNRNETGLPWLGASYATKVLYFGGWEAAGSAALRPIIMDGFVACAFRHLEDLDDHFHAGWCWRNYSQVLHRVRELAAKAGVHEDDIEYRLFEVGRGLYPGRVC